MGFKRIKVSPNTTASKRTKDRIREHGPEFALVGGPKNVQCFNGATAINLVANDGWMGWIPTAEINWEEV